MYVYPESEKSLEVCQHLYILQKEIIARSNSPFAIIYFIQIELSTCMHLLEKWMSTICKLFGENLLMQN